MARTAALPPAPPMGAVTLLDSRWRPVLGWVSVAAWSYSLVLQPLFQALLVLSGSPLVLPPIDPNAVDAALYGGLGLAAARTVEKLKK